jgi:hypothetical protein
MSRCAGVDIYIEEVRDAAEIFDILLRAGWGLNYWGTILYLPMGPDAGGGRWQKESLEAWPHVRSLLENGGAIGLGLRWQSAEPGGLFEFRQGRTLSILFDADRPTLQGCGHFTDMSWYLARLVEPLLEAECNILDCTCGDYS